MTYVKSVVAMLKKASFMGAFFLLLSTQSYAATSFCSREPIAAEFSVQQVIDGDTVRLHNGRSVRLIGINAPEMGGRGRTDQPYAVQAKQRLTALVKANNNKVSLRTGQESKDRYGRVLAYTYDRHGASFEEQLVAAGLAFHAVIAPNIELAECLVQAEEHARTARLGLWKHATYKPVQQIKAGGFTLLQGRVQSVQRNKGDVWLELGHSVTVNIPKAALQNFDNELFEDWQGRTLQTRGWVADRHGQQGQYARWRLTVSHPSMLQLK